MTDSYTDHFTSLTSVRRVQPKRLTNKRTIMDLGLTFYLGLKSEIFDYYSVVNDVSSLHKCSKLMTEKW